MARRRHLYASLLGLHGLLAEQEAMPPDEIVEKVKDAKSNMRHSVPRNEFRAVDDLVFDSAIRSFIAAKKGDSALTLKSYVGQLEAEIDGVARSHFQTKGEADVVPPHLDGRAPIGRNQQQPKPERDAQLEESLANRYRRAGNKGPRLIDIASPAPLATYSCTEITQNNPSETNCADPPANNYPTFDFTLTASIVATSSTTGAKTTTTFSTSGRSTGMCTYYKDCDGALVNDDFAGYADPSGPLLEENGTAEGYSFWWVLHNYGPATSGACSCDPYPAGTIWHNTDTNALTPTFWVAESGNTSSNCAGLVEELD